ncbi:MAG TPA: bifunctional phosphopantothenoylcysteine decarboxylase/phosphopantothenate--cysteine ligase CoaBC [Casimicrobiaceae bacterium]|nr:bifunctional phosphopantothenoylcysteine decarboxylase/phosphopantothenate--cysteine ligase CoaBC [Casimicrobiaceae bacterium]
MNETRATSPDAIANAAEPLSRIVLGVTGGIAAYKSAELVRLLVKDAVKVDVVLTDAGARFVSAMTFQALSGRPVHSDLWQSGADNAMGHIGLSRGADAILVAPATADFMSKLSHGVADDLLSTLCLARECPLLIAPAMNRQMWWNAATQRNVARLVEDGIAILGPDTGELACNEHGEGRMLEPEAIYDALVASRQPKVLAGKRVLLTAGPTVEAIDPVRSITNASSGKMGFALARAAAEAGAEVAMVAGPTALPTPAGVTRIDVRSTAEMAEAVLARVAECDIFIAVAAAADYTPVEARSQKIKKSTDNLTVALRPTIDILVTVAARPNPPFCVGFAAESQDVVRLAEEKRRRKKLPLIVANRAQDALNSNANEVTLLDDAGAHPLPKMDKMPLARRLVGEIANRMREG